MNLNSIRNSISQLSLAFLLAFASCSKFDPILPADRYPSHTAAASTGIIDPCAPWLAIQAGSHAISSESDCRIAASDIMEYINPITALPTNDSRYTAIQEQVFDCFTVLSQLKFTLRDDGSMQLETLVGTNGATQGKWKDLKNEIEVSLSPIPLEPSASEYTQQLAKHFGGATFRLKKIGNTLMLAIDGHFVCDPIVAFTRAQGMTSAQQLEAFSNVFEGFTVIFAQEVTFSHASPSLPTTPPSPSNKEIAHAWRIVRAGTSKDVSSEEGITASANATMIPINTVYTHLEKGGTEYNALRDEVAKCFRLFGQMTIELYRDGSARVGGPEGFYAAAQGTWKDAGEGNVSIQILSVTLKTSANRFEQRFANDFLTMPILLKRNSKTNALTWHIHGQFVIEPCGAYVKENGLPGYDGIMRFSKVFKGFDLHLETM